MDDELFRYVNLRLGTPAPANRLAPADARIQTFLDAYFAGFDVPRLPANAFVLDRPGLAQAQRGYDVPLAAAEYRQQAIRWRSVSFKV